MFATALYTVDFDTQHDINSMSPQFRANMNNTTLSSGCDDNVGCSSNPCLGAASSFLASSSPSSSNHIEFNTLHKISSESTTVTADTTNPLNHATSATSTDGTTSSNQLLLRKRSAARISSSSSCPKSPQFLSSYGSAFLSGIFADIAESGSTDGKIQDSSSSCTASSTHNVAAATNSGADDVSMMEPSPKKARTTTSTFNTISRQKSFKVLDGAYPEGADSMVVSSPPVVSPRSKASTVNLNDHVRMLQDMAFPSLPNMPITVSSSSCPSMSSSKIVTPTAATTTAGAESDEQDTSQEEGGPDAYGWFVATDDDMASADSNEHQKSCSESSSTTTTGFLPDIKPNLAFMAITAPQGGNQEIEVQQALAADTIDDVLGDLF